MKTRYAGHYIKYTSHSFVENVEYAVQFKILHINWVPKSSVWSNIQIMQGNPGILGQLTYIFLKGWISCATGIYRLLLISSIVY